MSGPALATRPANAPRNPAVRETTARLAQSGSYRREPDPVRSSPPPPRETDVGPDRPAYVPRPPARLKVDDKPAAKPVAAKAPPVDKAPDAGAEPKASPTEGPEKAGPDPAGATADGAAADGAAGGEAAADPKKPKSKLARPEAPEELPEVVEVPKPELGPVAMERESARLSDPASSFEGPLSLPVRPPSRADAEKDDRDPDIAAYPAVFAEAAAAARRLHDAVIADAQRAASGVLSAAATAADRRQADLDYSLTKLDEGLNGGLATVDLACDDALALIDLRAAQARAQIRLAAAGAHAALNAAKAQVIARKAPADAMRAASERKAAGYRMRLFETAGRAMARLVKLQLDPESEFPVPSPFLPMERAINEAIVARAPKRAAHRTTAYLLELIGQSNAMARSFDVLPYNFARAFATVDGWIESTGKAGPAAVEMARAAANKQLSKMARQLRGTVRAGRARTKASLIRQHDATRRQTIVAHKSRTKGEAAGDSRRGEKDVVSLKALAVAQGPATRVIADNLARQVGQGQKAYAQAVVTTSRNFAARVAQTNAGQRSRLAGASADGLAQSERASRGAGGRLRDQADAVAAQQMQAGQDAANGLFGQINDTSSSFDKLAQPVAKSMQGYLPPVGLAFEWQILKLMLALYGVDVAIESYIATGQAIEPAGAKPPPDAKKTEAKKDAGEPPRPAMMAPSEYMEMTGKVAGDPKTDLQIADLVKRAGEEIPKIIATKGTAVWDNISALGTNTEGVIGALRMITKKQGNAIRVWFYQRYDGRDIEAYIRNGLPKVFSARSTDRLNVEAAIQYLNGNQIEGALADLKAAVNYSNENARVERIARSLTPAQWATLNLEHADEIKDVRDDLGGLNQTVFDALQSEGEIQHRIDTNTQRPEDVPGSGVAKANAWRLREKIYDDRKKMGDEGADAAADTIENAALDAGNDALSGADALGLDEYVIDNRMDVTDEAGQRNARVWGRTKEAFDKQQLQLMPWKTPPAGAEAGWTIVDYAASKRDYKIWVKDSNEPFGGHIKVEEHGISAPQKQLIEMLVHHPPDSVEVAAARLIVETSRDSGRPKPERVDKAFHTGELDAHVGFDKAKLTDDQKTRQIAKVKERQAAVLRKVYELQHPGKEAAKDASQQDPETIRQKVVNDLTKVTMALDPTAAELVRRSMRGPKESWKDEQTERREDAKAAFDYAINHEADRAETLKRTFGRMDKDEITLAVAEWDAHAIGQFRPSLYTQLGLFGKGHWMFPAKLSGDERNDVELAAMGVARNKAEQALIARMRAQQQIRDAGILGKIAGKVTGDWDRLKEDRNRIDELLGLDEDSVDAMGQMTKQGAHINPDGSIKPSSPGSAAELELAMHMTHLSAESYKTMTDKLATAVTTALMVVAAVVTTALTGGAAASLWIPMLVTAGAGLVGMGLTAAIRGDRYTPAEMQRDLVMTFVQAATAGLGAAAGAAIKGGLPALKMLASSRVVANTVIQDLGKLGFGLSKGWGLVAEIGVGAGTNALNNYASAYMDPRNRQLGVSADKAEAAGWSGLLGGGFSAAIMRPAGALGHMVGGEYGARAFGGAIGNVGSRAVELGYQDYTGERSVDGAEFFEEVKTAGATGLIQSALEEKAGRSTDARRAARGAPRLPRETPTSTTRGGPVEEPRAAAPRREVEADAAPVPTQHPHAEAAPSVRPPPVPEKIVVPMPPAVAPIAKLAQEQLRPDHLPPVVTEPVASPKPRPATAEPDVVPGSARQGSGGDGDAPVADRPRRAEDPGAPAPRRDPKKPPPIPISEAKGLEGGVMYDPKDARNPAEVYRAYRNAIRHNAGHEVAVYRNPVTGERILVFGSETMAYIAGAGGERMSPRRGGREQQWKKDLLPHDVGHWELEAHYHPGHEGRHDFAPMARRIPSTGETGVGDFPVLRAEAHVTGRARVSEIHWTHEGREGVTYFGHDPHGSAFKYWIDVENPTTGRRELHTFEDIPAYEAWAAGHGVVTSRTEPGRPAGGPGVPGSAAHEPEITVHHGTNKAAAASMKEKGINPQHAKSGDRDDFSHGFYLTTEEKNGKTYARRRSQGPDDEEVISTSIKLSELGEVMDVRPGGSHHEAWNEFLDRKPPAFPTDAATDLAYKFGMYKTAREYMTPRKGWIVEAERGKAFDTFLAEKGLLGTLDAVIGPLGKDALTGGIGEGTQIAIYSKRAANVLNERLGYPKIAEDDVIPGSARQKEAFEKPGILRTAEEKKHAFRKLSDAELEAEGIVRPPPLDPPDHTEAAKADHAAKLKAIDQEGIDAFLKARPAEATLYLQLKAVAPEVLEHAVRGNAPTAMLEADLRQALAAKKIPPAQIEDHVAALKTLLRPTEARTGDYRAALASGAVTHPDVETWKQTHRPTNPGEAPKRGGRKKGTVQVMDPADYAAALARQMDAAAAKHQKTNPTYGAGVREFINVARERAAWRDLVPDDLEKRVAAAIDKELALEGVRRMRGRDPLVPTDTEANPTPHREAFQALDEVDRPLLTELARQVTDDPAKNALLVAEWGARRQGAPGVSATDILREMGQLKAALDHPELLGLINEARAIQDKLKIDHSKIRAIAMSDHLLLSFAATNPDGFAWAYAQLATHVPSDKKTPRQTSFPADVIRTGLQELMTAHLKPALSEASSAFRLAAEIGAVALEVPSMTKGRTNDGGIDAALVVPPAFHYPPPSGSPAGEPENVRVVLVDDKAEQAKQLSKAPALTTNLAENLRTMGQEHLDAIEARKNLPQPEGLSPYDKALRQHLEKAQAQAVKQIMAAAAEIDAIPAATRAGGIKSEAYGKAVAKILKDHGIEMTITSEHGNIVEVADWMRHWGLNVWDAEKAARRKQAPADPGDGDGS